MTAIRKAIPNDNSGLMAVKHLSECSNSRASEYLFLFNKVGNMLETQSSALSMFAYQGATITFQQGGALMVNATEMSKPFGKRVAHWLANQQTDELISRIY